MAKLNPKASSNEYKEQGVSAYAQMVDGTFDVVNIALQRQVIGQKKTPKLQVKAVVLAVVSTDDPNKEDEAQKNVGKMFSFDMWMNLFDENGEVNANGRRLNFLALANRNTDEFDPDVDGDLVKALTGQPYRITIKMKSYINGKGEQRFNAEPIKTVNLDKAGCERYTKQPHWQKTIGDVSKRMLESKDYSPANAKSSTSASTTSSNDEQFADDDLPF